jgi:hypothetical protein
MPFRLGERTSRNFDCVSNKLIRADRQKEAYGKRGTKYKAKKKVVL